MRDEEDYVEIGNRELREPFKHKIARARERMHNPKIIYDPMERVKNAKVKRDVDAYKKGVREGWDQAVWLIFALAVGIAILA